ncbi:hypothetical protein BDP81DRAFT_103731 [Colletotrichum phormii]|uniref:Uncharacterized protein n=1 Tax=Colletotrichum phormii TaxID=359342 RepID=A0AAI9ZI27_9PEZI|nr:uncharacterized protein BDP81DRAFT_103731 [Colletotrichum phormii]KAK1624965.1 hypothetical protein BDP81DRAFT_103731 [Colletotrichum phormii]
MIRRPPQSSLSEVQTPNDTPSTAPFERVSVQTPDLPRGLAADSSPPAFPDQTLEHSISPTKRGLYSYKVPAIVWTLLAAWVTIRDGDQMQMRRDGKLRPLPSYKKKNLLTDTAFISTKSLGPSESATIGSVGFQRGATIAIPFNYLAILA